MIGIQTRYLGPTETKGARVKAWTADWGSVTVKYDEPTHDADEIRGTGTVQAHWRAVLKLLEREYKYGSPASYPYTYGSTPDGRGYLFCFESSSLRGYLNEDGSVRDD